MIREDRILLADLGQLNTDVAPLAMRIIDESATAEEQYAFADRLAAMALRLQARVAQAELVVDGEVSHGEVALGASGSPSGGANTARHQGS